MKYFSMFSGIGGFEHGIQRVCIKNEETMERIRSKKGQLSQFIDTKSKSFTCIGYSEIDKYAIQIYEKHFKGHKNYGDCKNIIWPDVRDFELLVGGFPCQSFSIAGKRGGFIDTRGTLFFEIARCLKEKQPRLCLLENVKGLLSHDKGNTFLRILTTLDELGYDLQWQVLNSKNFGVPQNRERVFIVGHLRGTSRPEVFPIGENATKININIIGSCHPKNKTMKVHSSDGLSSTLLGQGGNVRKSGTNTVLPHISDDMRIRRLTPTECERLQGFPDGWTEGISDTQRYKCLGNAVTVNVIETIMSKLITIG